jgi:hypothetical protein
MRKRITPPQTFSSSSIGEDDHWMDLTTSARVELSSEEAAHPIEGAILLNGTGGWRGDGATEQTIRLIFDEPQAVRRIFLIFERDTPLSHEFVLRWSESGLPRGVKIVRQQWNFSPPDATHEVEDYRVALFNVKMLELVITPRGASQDTTACLRQLRIAA